MFRPIVESLTASVGPAASAGSRVQKLMPQRQILRLGVQNLEEEGIDGAPVHRVERLGHQDGPAQWAVCPRRHGADLHPVPPTLLYRRGVECCGQPWDPWIVGVGPEGDEAARAHSGAGLTAGRRSSDRGRVHEFGGQSDDQWLW
jgi:hypothetical protein